MGSFVNDFSGSMSMGGIMHPWTVPINFCRFLTCSKNESFTGKLEKYLVKLQNLVGLNNFLVTFVPD